MKLVSLHPALSKIKGLHLLLKGHPKDHLKDLDRPPDHHLEPRQLLPRKPSIPRETDLIFQHLLREWWTFSAMICTELLPRPLLPLLRK